MKTSRRALLAYTGLSLLPFGGCALTSGKTYDRARSGPVGKITLVRWPANELGFHIALAQGINLHSNAGENAARSRQFFEKHRTATHSFYPTLHESVKAELDKRGKAVSEIDRGFWGDSGEIDYRAIDAPHVLENRAVYSGIVRISNGLAPAFRLRSALIKPNGEFLARVFLNYGMQTSSSDIVLPSDRKFFYRDEAELFENIDKTEAALQHVAKTFAAYIGNYVASL